MATGWSDVVVVVLIMLFFVAVLVSTIRRACKLRRPQDQEPLSEAVVQKLVVPLYVSAVVEAAIQVYGSYTNILVLTFRLVALGAKLLIDRKHLMSRDPGAVGGAPITCDWVVITWVEAFVVTFAFVFTDAADGGGLVSFVGGVFMFGTWVILAVLGGCAPNPRRSAFIIDWGSRTVVCASSASLTLGSAWYISLPLTIASGIGLWVPEMHMATEVTVAVIT